MASPRKRANKADSERDALYARFAVCRAEGHEWRHLGRGNGLNAPPRFYGMIPMDSSCNNCGALRTKWFTSAGRSAGTDYKYPEHYAQRGEGKMDRDDWGGLFIRSVLSSAA